MQRTWPIWTGFAAVLLVVLGTMVWISALVFDLDHSHRETRRLEAEAKRLAAWEENSRLALWRVDSMAAPLIARESARPYFVYRSFLPSDRPFENMYNPIEVSNGVEISPLTFSTASHVRFHFQFEPDGTLISPSPPETASSEDLDWLLQHLHPEEIREQLAITETNVANVGNNNSVASNLAINNSLYMNNYRTPEEVETHSKTRGQVEYQMRQNYGQQAAIAVMNNEFNSNEMAQQTADVFQQSPLFPQGEPSQAEGSDDEQQLERDTISLSPPSLPPASVDREIDEHEETPQAGQVAQPTAQGRDRQVLQEYAVPSRDDPPWHNVVETDEPDAFEPESPIDEPIVLDAQRRIRTSVMVPVWIGEELALVREVCIGDASYVQGCVLDWPSLQKTLRESIVDLLPSAGFEPIDADAEPLSGDEWHRLATLPVRLTYDYDTPSLEDIQWETSRGDSPLRVSLAIAWACVLIAMATAAGLVIGVMTLGRRRSQFVTAVTHELRTPLTTFQMYSEMLAEGMVDDPESRQSYLETLRSEAGRLTHMVENVLAYARLNRGRNGPDARPILAGDMLAPSIESLGSRLEREGRHLVVEGWDETESLSVCASASVVDQILFNLIDNACKYGDGPDDDRIHLQLSSEGSTLKIAVQDHGPGLPSNGKHLSGRKLWAPFSKSAEEAAADKKPGIGLGLALSRRLAGTMKARLEYDEDYKDGARFVLELPLCEEG
jgi:signal transduction histidine kinase